MTEKELAQWFADIHTILENAYIQHPDTEPWRQSGMSGPYHRWELQRKPIADCVDKSGTFLDIGCANGYLLECCMRWVAERELGIVPFGLDLSPKLLALARARLPQYADNFFEGNSYYWIPSQKFDYVSTALVYVPAEYERVYVEHLLQHCVKPGGHLLIVNFTEDHPNPEQGIMPGSHPTKYLAERLAELHINPLDYKDGHDYPTDRHVRVAIIGQKGLA
jgi:SAM-dependent methyltransferase